MLLTFMGQNGFEPLSSDPKSEVFAKLDHGPRILKIYLPNNVNLFPEIKFKLHRTRALNFNVESAIFSLELNSINNFVKLLLEFSEMQFKINN